LKAIVLKRLDGSEVAMSDPFFAIKGANMIADFAQ
jgi:hypothetical protein